MEATVDHLIGFIHAIEDCLAEMEIIRSKCRLEAAFAS